jgi:hypothetical protein
MTSQKTTFDEWMKELDKVLSSYTGGITHDDLPDADYCGYFDDGISVRDAIRDFVWDDWVGFEPLQYLLEDYLSVTDES